MADHVTILMIEDNEGHAKLIEKGLRRAGIHNDLVHFADGTTALHYLFGEDQPGQTSSDQGFLVLLDLNLPDMSGIDILTRIKADDRLKRAPVLVLTTTDDKVEIQRCYELGANVYVTKPVVYEEFANAIRLLGLFFSVVQVPDGL